MNSTSSAHLIHHSNRDLRLHWVLHLQVPQRCVDLILNVVTFIHCVHGLQPAFIIHFQGYGGHAGSVSIFRKSPCVHSNWRPILQEGGLMRYEPDVRDSSHLTTLMTKDCKLENLLS